MRSKRSFVTAVSAVSVLLAALFATGGPALAAVPSADGPVARVITLPPAPAGAGSAVSAKAAAAVSPTTSPAVRTEHGPPGTTYVCEAGNFCTNVWDPTTNDWKTFFFYNCNRYYLSDWNGEGNYWNNQTGNVTTYFYGQSGNVLTSFQDVRKNVDYNWDPVWSIRNC
ncbi:hypothetical protein ACFWWC_48590 [Streptomyces sp. NPDC058642]|uniref:hypothetical protein n=1 Tax=Streptomyces sp. NPDC058642 TaxID=3346572 RepID=UPI00365BEDA7